MSSWTEPSVRPTHGKSEWLTDCKLCRAGIYKGQPKVWLRSPMGYSHEWCAQRAERDRADADAHRLAEVAHQLAHKVRVEERDAVARWVCGELDGLERWQLLFMLAAMVPADRSPGELLALFWDRQRAGVSV